jgi:hypothetical protein
LAFTQACAWDKQVFWAQILMIILINLMYGIGEWSHYGDFFTVYSIGENSGLTDYGLNGRMVV